MQQQSNDDELQALLHFLARVPTGNASTIALTSPIEQALALRRHFDMQQAQVTLHQPLRQPSAPVLSSPFDPQGVMRTLVAMATQGISIATVLQVSDTGSDPFARLPTGRMVAGGLDSPLLEVVAPTGAEQQARRMLEAPRASQPISDQPSPDGANARNTTVRRTTSSSGDAPSQPRPDKNYTLNELLSSVEYLTPTFQVKLFRLIVNAERNRQTHIIQFTPAGDAILLHDRDALMKELVPKHLRLKSFASFRRQMCLYCFEKRPCGSSLEYKHDLFHRDFPMKLNQLVRLDSNRRRNNEHPPLGVDSAEKSSSNA